MAVKILTEAQKDAVALLYSHRRKNQKELALALNVSERTINRVIEQYVMGNPEPDMMLKGKSVMSLLYKHKMTPEQLESYLDNPSRVVSGASSNSDPVFEDKTKAPELSMAAVQTFLCGCTKDELATLFYTSGLAKLLEIVTEARAKETKILDVPILKPGAPIPKSAQEPLNFGVKHVPHTGK